LGRSFRSAPTLRHQRRCANSQQEEKRQQRRTY
jgi:hypothetical protein